MYVNTPYVHIHVLYMYMCYILCITYIIYILDMGIIIDIEQNQQNDEN